jgi:hypothetical protein
MVVLWFELTNRMILPVDIMVRVLSHQTSVNPFLMNIVNLILSYQRRFKHVRVIMTFVIVDVFDCILPTQFFEFVASWRVVLGDYLVAGVRLVQLCRFIRG